MGEATESLDSFRDRARAWIDGNLPRAGDPAPIDDRTIQNALFDAGFAGIAFPGGTEVPASPSSTRRCSSL